MSKRTIGLEQVSKPRLTMGECLIGRLGSAGNTVLKLVLAFAITLLGLCRWSPAQDVRFLFERVVDVPKVEDEALVAVELDEPVYLAAGNDFDDLRLINESGEFVPFLLRKVRDVRTRNKRTTWTSSDVTARPLDDDGLEILIALDKDEPVPHGMRIVSPLRDFEHRIRVYAAANGTDWQPLGNETLIFDYSRYMDVRSDTVTFPTTSHRRFRVVIDAVTSGQESQLLELTRRLRGGKLAERVERIKVDRRPFRIERIEFWSEEQEERWAGDKTKSYPVSNLRVEEDSDSQQTLVFVDTPRTPLNAFQFETATRNFSRRFDVAVEDVQGTKTSWRSISHDVLSRIDFKDLQREELKISFPETRQAKYRITIENRDSPPLQVTGVRAEGHVYQLLFLASQESNYRLLYGSDQAARPDYDTMAIQAVLDAGFTAIPAALGEPLDGSEASAKSTLWDQLREPRFLIALILILVVILGLTLYSAVRRLDSGAAA